MSFDGTLGDDYDDGKECTTGLHRTGGRAERRRCFDDFLTRRLATVRTIILYLATLAAAGCGGWAFYTLNIPLPWLLGPLLTIAALSMLGLDLATPRGSRQTGQVLLATGIGLNFTPMVAIFVAENLWVMVLTSVASISFGAVAGLLLMRTAKTDVATAYFSCVPGGVAEMSIQAERWGGDPAPVSLAQSLRILTVVTTIPPVLILAGATGIELFQAHHIPFDAPRFAMLLAMTAAGGALLAWRRITNAWLLGPLGVAAGLTAMQIELSGMPREVLNVSQVLIGATLGLRYKRDAVLGLRRFLVPALLSTIALVSLNVVFGALVGWLTGLPIATMILSVSPGGMSEMSITAKVLGLGVPFVAAFHIVRIFLVIALSGLMFRYIYHRQKRPN